MGRWLEWKYKPRAWKFVYKYFTKSRPKYRRSSIKAKQYAVKTGKDTYRLIMKGKRKPY